MPLGRGVDGERKVKRCPEWLDFAAGRQIPRAVCLPLCISTSPAATGSAGFAFHPAGSVTRWVTRRVRASSSKKSVVP